MALQIRGKQAELEEKRQAEQAAQLRNAVASGTPEQVQALLDAGANPNMTNEKGEAPLHIAANTDRAEMVAILKKAGANLDQPDNEGNTPLALASIYTGDNNALATLDALLKAGADKNAVNKKGQTPLHIAAYANNAGAAELLVQAGADMQKIDGIGMTPLMAAAATDHMATLNTFLKHKDKFDIDGTGAEGKTALQAAIYCHKEAAATALLDAGADIEKPNEKGSRPLFIAAANNNVSALNALLKRGAKIDAAGPEGKTAFAIAIIDGKDDAAKTLLTAGANKDKPDDFDQTPTLFAASFGRIAILEKLLDAGADKNKANKDGETPLFRAADRGHIDALEALLKAGADTEIGNKVRATPLHIASRRGLEKAVALLLAHEANIDAMDENGTALHKATCEGHTGVMRLLLEAGADKNKANNFGTTPLIQAAQEGKLDAAILLLDEKIGSGKIEINKQNPNNGATALALAAYCGHLDLVNLLLERGADPHIECHNGGTALLLAKEAGHTKIAARLQEAEKNVSAAGKLKDSDKDMSPMKLLTLLASAANDGKLDEVKALVKQPAFGQVKDEVAVSGMTPLISAMGSGHVDVVAVLLEAGCAPEKGVAIQGGTITPSDILQMPAMVADHGEQKISHMRQLLRASENGS